MKKTFINILPFSSIETNGGLLGFNKNLARELRLSNYPTVGVLFRSYSVDTDKENYKKRELKKIFAKGFKAFLPTLKEDYKYQL